MSIGRDLLKEENRKLTYNTNGAKPYIKIPTNGFIFIPFEFSDNPRFNSTHKCNQTLVKKQLDGTEGSDATNSAQFF